MANSVSVPKKIIGKQILLTDCNDAIIPGQSYRTTTNTLNKPFEWDYVHIFCLGRNDNNIWQIAMRMNVNPDTIAYRVRYNNGTWGTWQRLESLIDNKINDRAKIIGCENQRYLQVILSEASQRYGVLYFILPSGISLFSLYGGAPTLKDGTMTATYDSSTGTYEFDTGSAYTHGVVIAGGALACYGTFKFHV